MSTEIQREPVAAPIKQITLHTRHLSQGSTRQITAIPFGGSILFRYDRSQVGDPDLIGGDLIESKQEVRAFAQALLDLCNQ